MTDTTLTRNMAVLCALFGWFVFVVKITAEGWLTWPDHMPPFMLGLCVAVPVLLSTVLYSRRQWLWSFSNALELRLLVLLHIWRLAAITFIVEYNRGLLPAGFALPAGIGDIATAIFAIPLVISMQNNAQASYKRFISWNLFGMADLFLAVALGIMHSDSPIGILKGAGASTGMMAQLPLSIVPTFFVPLFISTHILMLSRAKELLKTA